MLCQKIGCLTVLLAVGVLRDVASAVGFVLNDAQFHVVVASETVQVVLDETTQRSLRINIFRQRDALNCLRYSAPGLKFKRLTDFSLVLN